MMPQYRFFDKIMVAGDEIFTQLIQKFDQALNADRSFQLQMPQDMQDFTEAIDGSNDTSTNPEAIIGTSGGQLVQPGAAL